MLEKKERNGKEKKQEKISMLEKKTGTRKKKNRIKKQEEKKPRLC